MIVMLVRYKNVVSIPELLPDLEGIDINSCRVSKHPELQFPRIDIEEIDRKLSAIEEKNNNLDSNKPKQKIKGLEKK